MNATNRADNTDDSVAELETAVIGGGGLEAKLGAMQTVIETLGEDVAILADKIADVEECHDKDQIPSRDKCYGSPGKCESSFALFMHAPELCKAR